MPVRWPASIPAPAAPGRAAIAVSRLTIVEVASALLRQIYPVGLTDATVAALAERVQCRVATLDRRHFTKLRTARGKAFKIVP